MRNTLESPQGLLERGLRNIRRHSPTFDHFNTTGHSINIDNFSIVGREDHSLNRALKEALLLCNILLLINAILAIALLKAIVEAMSDNRDISRVFHHSIFIRFQGHASALFYCIRSSRYFHSS